MPTIEAALIVSLLSATVLAIFGFLKRQPEESFKPEKLVSTYVAAVFVAVLTVGWKVPTEQAEEMFLLFVVRSGLIVYIERGLKALWRRWIHEPFEKWMEGLREG